MDDRLVSFAPQLPQEPAYLPLGDADLLGSLFLRDQFLLGFLQSHQPVSLGLGHQQLSFVHPPCWPLSIGHFYFAQIGHYYFAATGVHGVSPQPNKIGPATPYDFDGKNLTAYGGLLPVGTLLEKLGFHQLIEETLKVNRLTRVMPAYQFILAMVLACYVGFSRLHHMRFLQRDPMLTGILGVQRLPPQCTFWRFLASLHRSIAGPLMEVQRRMRHRVWEAANVKLSAER